MNGQRKVLICPLDWGLGHASRCIPIIHDQLSKGNLVYLASNGRAKEYLKGYFPELTFLPDPPAYAVRYSTWLPLMMKLALQTPRLLSVIRRENQWLQSMIEQYAIDTVISDNRYGLYSNKANCILITHQTAPLFPTAVKSLFHRKMYKWYHRFSAVHIPDEFQTEHSLGFDLSHKNVPENAIYIGFLSRFFTCIDETVNLQYAIVALVSGPEPERSRREDALKKQILQNGRKAILLRGIPDAGALVFENGHWSEGAYPNDDQLSAMLRGCEIIISGCGYSSLMDMRILGVMDKVQWYATPGQTEQEYLYKIHNKSRL